MKTKLTLLLVLFFAAALTLTLTAHAAIPHILNFQGKVTDKSGVPLSGTYNLTFRIYNSETGGSQKWSETQGNIPISNGIFQAQLGSVTPLNLTFDEPYWISIEINTDGEMSPRTKLASVPYAYKAESLAKDPVIPFYKKGFDVEYVDFNSVKITPGVMDLAGTMFTTTTYSNPLQLTYLDSPANRDWVHGQKTNDSNVYVYAYNNNGKLDFKFSDEPPDLSDQYGNVVGKPFFYQKYPDTAEGVYYRSIGKVYINTSGIVVITDSPTAGVPAGTVMAWTTSNPPDGWLLCDGSEVSRTGYATLFGVIGTSYGYGNGTSTFTLPNLKGKVPVGFNSAETEFDAIGKTGGAKIQTTSTVIGAVPYFGGSQPVSTPAHSHTVSSLQPYITLQYIIKT